MKKEDAIKYLQQLYPNGGHCWLDEQRIEAIGMAVKALQEEPVSEVWYDARKSVPENSISQIICIKEDGLAIATEGRIVSGTIKWAYLSDLLNLDNSCNFEKNLQKELVSDIDFEQELYKAFGQVKDFTLGMRIAKWFYDMGKNNQEPVSEELKEASKEWIRPQLDKSYANYGETKMMELTRFDGYAMLDAIEFGAQWKEQQFEKNRLAHCDAQTEEEAEIESDFVMGIIEKEHRQPTFDDAIKYGMKLQKKQMIKDAYEREVKVDAGGYPYIPQMELYDYNKDVPLAKEGDKYKVVLIKEN